jgi:hypothetical protein
MDSPFVAAPSGGGEEEVAMGTTRLFVRAEAEGEAYA